MICTPISLFLDLVLNYLFDTITSTFSHVSSPPPLSSQSPTFKHITLRFSCFPITTQSLVRNSSVMPSIQDAKEADDWNRVLSGGVTGDISSMIPADLSGTDAVQHADDAIDYEGEDELADEEELAEEELPDIEGDILSDTEYNGEPFDEVDDGEDWAADLAEEGKPDVSEADEEFSTLDKLLNSTGGFLNELDSVITSEYADQIAESQTQNDAEMLKVYYPDFKPGEVLKMNTLFAPKPAQLVLPKPKLTRRIIAVRTNLEIDGDQRIFFRSDDAGLQERYRRDNRVINITEEYVNYLLNGNENRTLKSKEMEREDELTLSAANWDMIFNTSDSDLDMSDEPNNIDKMVRKRQHGLQLPLNYSDLYDSEDEEAILEGTYRPRTKKLRLDLNDPNLLFVEDSVQRRLASVKRTTDIPRTEKQLEQRYNVSNDRAYDMLKENYQSKVRSTIGNLTIDHSMVALRLQSPYYKVKLSKAQMRSHHRPTFLVRPNTVLSFSKLKQRKKKRDKGKHVTQLLSTTKDMTLGDSAGLFLTEYSEEFPLALSNFGMGSKLINYYRKETPEDNNRPKLNVGETSILGVQDRSPFWNFGFVEPGNTVPTLYNRMIRAPVFRHSSQPTDFLMARSTSSSRGQKLFLRPIPNLFVVGQTFPVTGIPGPHSRKVTTASKNRLKMVAFRLLNKNEFHRLQVRDISPHFPDQNEMQNRQRLKEFMEYQRGGEDQSYWKVKTGEILPNEEAIRAMISPEDITLLEAMQVGQQHLEDSGYGKTIDDDSVEDQDGMSIEEQIAPWNVTRNFINATQGKAMLQLHGAGDPSTRGEAFSFLRTSMKGGFKAMGESVNEKLDKTKFGGHSYNVAMQQKAYDEEIKRIWYAQAKSLSVTSTDGLQWDEAENNRMSNHEEDQRSEEQPSKPEDDEMSLFSHASGISHKAKVLQITRMFKDENGTLQRKTEIVKDPNVIRAYIKRRHEIEDSQIAPEEIAPTNDEEKNRRLKKILLTEKARLERNKERQMARKAEKLSEGKSKGKATTRKCASCGAVGHIRTNKACPLYYETIGAEAPTATVGSNSASPAAN